MGLFSPDHVIASGVEQRLPFGLVDNGIRLTGESDGVDVTVRRDGTVIGRVLVPGQVVAHDDGSLASGVHRQHSDLLRYYAPRLVLPEPGIYDLVVDVGGREATLSFQAFDPAEVVVPIPGDPFPALQTPTVDAARGVDPVCTRKPSLCPFHDRSAADLLDAHVAMAVLVSTPSYCSTAYCGPVLETLIRVAPDFATVVSAVHLEVYANPAEVDGNIADPRIRVAPAVQSLGLTFEPSLFVVDRSGVVRDRIDNVFSADELRTALARIA